MFCTILWVSTPLVCKQGCTNNAHYLLDGRSVSERLRYVIIHQIKQPLRDVCQVRKNTEKAPLFSRACSLAGRYDNPIPAQKQFNECLSRQPSLVINIVGTDDISRLPRLVRV